MGKVKKKKKSGYRPKVKITTYREADRQLMDFFMRPENRRMRRTAQAQFLDAAEVKKFPKDLYPFFVDWCLFDYRKTAGSPTVVQRFVKARPQLDKETRERILALSERGISGFFTVVQGDLDGCIIVQELGGEISGGYRVQLTVSTPPEEGSILEGRLVPWDGEWRFASGYVVLSEIGNPRLSGDLRELRQKYNVEEWRFFMAHFKPRFWRSLMRNRDVEALIRDAAQAPKATPQTLELEYMQSLFRKGETAKVIALAESRLRSDPGNTQLSGLLIGAYQQNNQIDEALNLFEKLAQADPDDVRLRVQMAQFCLENELYDRAKKALEPALQFRDHALALVVRSAYGSSLYQSGQKDRGREFMLRAVEKAPGDVDVVSQAAAALFWGDEPAEVKRILLDCQDQQGPLPPHLSILLANCYYFNQDWQEALVIFEQIAQRTEAPWLSRMIGNCAFELGRYTRARQSYDAFLREASEDEIRESGSVLFRLAYLEWKRGMHERALPHIQRALKNSPYHPDLLWLLAEIRWQRREKVRAQAAVAMLLRVYPEHPALPSLLRRLMPDVFRYPRAMRAYGKRRPWRRFRCRVRKG